MVSDDARTDDSTLRRVRLVHEGPRSMVGRRLGALAIAVLVGLGLVGALGVRTSTESASGGGYRLAVEHARIARTGLDVPWSVRVDNPDGFDGDITLAVTSRYFEIFETQGLDPAPSEETADGTWRYWTFSPPPGTTFTVDFDAYIQPSAQRGRSGTVAVLVDGEPVVSVDFTTSLLP